MKYQTFNSVIDHISKKCLIFINCWREDETIDNMANKLIVISGAIPKNNRRIDNMTKKDSKVNAPINRYLKKIFKRTKSIPYCLSINSQFKNVIKDADGIHCFVKQKDKEEIEYKFLKDTDGSHNIDKSMMFYGNFL